MELLTLLIVDDEPIILKDCVRLYALCGRLCSGIHTDRGIIHQHAEILCGGGYPGGAVKG